MSVSATHCHIFPLRSTKIQDWDLQNVNGKLKMLHSTVTVRNQLYEKELLTAWYFDCGIPIHLQLTA